MLPPVVERQRRHVGRADHRQATATQSSPCDRRSGYGRGRSMTASTTLKIAVFAPMPSASVSTTAAVKAGALRSARTAYRKSCSRPCTKWTAGSGAARVESPPPEIDQRTIAAPAAGTSAGPLPRRHARPARRTPRKDRRAAASRSSGTSDQDRSHSAMPAAAGSRSCPPEIGLQPLPHPRQPIARLSQRRGAGRSR